MNEQQFPTSLTYSLLNSIPTCSSTSIVHLKANGWILYATLEARHILGLPRSGAQPLDQQWHRELKPALERGETIEEFHIERGVYRVIPFHPSTQEEVILFWHEITAQKRYEQLMNLANYLVDNTLDGVILTNAEGTIERVNPAFSRITGFSPEEVVGATPSVLKSDHHQQSFYTQMWEKLNTLGIWQGEIWDRAKDGSTVVLWEVITRVGNSRSRETKYLALFHELQRAEHSEDYSLRHFHYDILTGLPNRQLFYDRLSQAIASARREGDSIAVLLLDIDNFKKVNESLGHRHGDTYLQVVSDRLSSVCREEDTIARLGGDEFGIINLRLGNQNHALEILERISSVLQKPITLDSYEIIPSASIGVTFFPEDGPDSEALMQNSELAMYKAKNNDRGRYALFNQELHNRAQHRITLEANLNRALQQDEFELFYQPKVRASDGIIAGVEALVRWNHAGMIVSPADFIPIAEETGMIYPLGRWIMKKACADLLRLNKKGTENLRMSVNVSGKQFRDSSLVNQLESIFTESGTNPQNIIIEITENVAISDIESTVHMMQELMQLGLGISIDDFGTGYSSLAYIKSFTAQELKIDRSFIKDLPHDPGDRAIVKAVVSMAQELGMEVTAEGVETEEQHKFLQSLNCDCLQGYYFSPPVPFDSLEALLQGEHY